MLKRISIVSFFHNVPSKQHRSTSRDRSMDSREKIVLGRRVGGSIPRTTSTVPTNIKYVT